MSPVVIALAAWVVGCGPVKSEPGFWSDRCARSCCYDLREQVGRWQAPSLWIGAEAPALEIDSVVAGDALDGLERGRVYVVELWATWCAPCIASFPHLTELQSLYADRVRVVAVNTRDGRPDESADSKRDRVRGFIEAQGERAGFTVAIENEERDMASTWLEPAGRQGLPMSFLIDRDGRVAWMGHPMELDEPLRRVVDGTWDLQTAAAEVEASFTRMHDMYEGVTRFRARLLDEHADLESVYRFGSALACQLGRDDAQMLNALAWTAVSSDVSPDRRDSAFAIELLRRAMRLTDGQDGAINASLATALRESGDLESAADSFERAIAIFDKSQNENAALMLEQLQGRLDEVRAEIAAAGREPDH